VDVDFVSPNVLAYLIADGLATDQHVVGGWAAIPCRLISAYGSG
jgi:hypothetical protein